MKDLKKLFSNIADDYTPLEPSAVIGGVQFFVKRLTVGNMTQFLTQIQAVEEKKDGLEKARELACMIYSDNGELVFDMKNGDDLAIVANLPAWVYSKFNEDFNRINFLKKQDPAA